MERKIYHGEIKPADVAHALIGEFNQGNLRAQTISQGSKTIVQIGTRPGAQSGGQTALTVSLQKLDDGVMVEIGQQAWMGVAASLGATAFAALRNPLSLLSRLDDIAQDLENLQLTEKIWGTIAKAAKSAGASAELSDKLKRLACEYCGAANAVGESNCGACGAPLGKQHPDTCKHCGFVVKSTDKTCPNCRKAL